MTTVKDIYDYINSFAPFKTQESWDNSGMLAGDINRSVQTAAVCLDITGAAVQEAQGLGAELMISHHPVIFHPLYQVRSGDVVYELIKNGISAICTHTSLDLAQGGVNDVLIELLGIKDVRIVETDEGYGCLKAGKIKRQSAKAFAKFVAERLGTTVRLADGGRELETVAVCSGGGASFLPDVCREGIDALLTGDAKHDNFVDAKNQGISLIAAGHYETENPAMPVLAKMLGQKFPELKIICLDTQPVEYITAE